MRKRRRLANKMTIMVCAVLLAVSAFFYAPMEVSASDSNSGNFSYSTWLNDNAQKYTYKDSDAIVFPSGFDSDSYFKIDYTLNYNISSSDNFQNSWINYLNILFRGKFLLQNKYHASLVDNVHIGSVSGSFVLNGSQLYDDVNKLRFMLYLENSTNVRLDIAVDYDFVIDNISLLSSNESDDYQIGYNAGYSAGESAGYGNGYSQGFTDGEASVDTDAIYDEAFQAGKDSVDTQSYYDAGYQAGYQVAYSDGYESGYDSGYQDAMDRFANWGADTTDYPKLLTTKTMSKWGISSEVQVGVVQDIHATLGVDLGVSVDPNHTYMFDVSVSDYDVTGPSTIDSPANHDLFFYVGSNKYYLISQNKTSCNQTLYVPGSIISDVFGFSGDAYNVHVLESQSTDQIVYTYLAYTVKMYDMGPSGDTQNHIANQTDQLTNGYDDSKGNKVNSDLSSGLNDYESAENSLFATATTGMNDFTFFDFESVPAMITGMSFIGSIMGSWFNQAGGASGVGIVLSILFSVILVAMVLGLYRWYQSRGGKN